LPRTASSCATPGGGWRRHISKIRRCSPAHDSVVGNLLALRLSRRAGRFDLLKGDLGLGLEKRSSAAPWPCPAAPDPWPTKLPPLGTARSRSVSPSFSSHQLCPEKQGRNRTKDDEASQVSDIATRRYFGNGCI